MYYLIKSIAILNIIGTSNLYAQMLPIFFLEKSCVKIYKNLEKVNKCIGLGIKTTLYSILIFISIDFQDIP